MQNGFKDQVAVVTGAASGIGLAIAKSLAMQGARLALIDKNVEALKAVARSFTFDPFPSDIASEKEVEMTITKITAAYGRIDILVNSAGITGTTNIKSHETETVDVQKVFDINFFGSYF